MRGKRPIARSPASAPSAIILCLALLSSCGKIDGRPAEAAATPSGRASGQGSLVFGDDEGLFSLEGPEARPLGIKGPIRKLIRAGDSLWVLAPGGPWRIGPEGRAEAHAAGLPAGKRVAFVDGAWRLLEIPTEVVDLSVDPSNHEILSLVTLDGLYASFDAGASWASVPSSFDYPGFQSVCVFTPDEGPPVALVSHAWHGFLSARLGQPDPEWLSMNEGIDKSEESGTADGLSSIVALAFGGATRIFMAGAYAPVIYEFDWASKSSSVLWRGRGDSAAIASLAQANGGLAFSCDYGILELPLADRPETHPLLGIEPGTFIEAESHLKAIRALGRNPQAMSIALPGTTGHAELSGLWLIDAPFTEGGLRGIYVPAAKLRSKAERLSLYQSMEASGINAIVVDAKDDAGLLSFKPDNPEIAKLGKVGIALPLEDIAKEASERGFRLIGRIVAFQDPVLYARDGGALAVWDPAKKRPWVGLSGERWIDPFSTRAWEYLAAIAQEIADRGFDEAQFDYIRLPTDGAGLASAGYRHNQYGLSAREGIASFLSYVREALSISISIDVYGANAWFASPLRSGQDLAALAPLVDVISPMLYPSHFSPSFLRSDPAALRPFGIYRQGVSRCRVNTRGLAAIRPWVQAFTYPGANDRAMYGKAYIRLQADGALSADAEGLLFWNSVGDYEVMRGARW